MWAYLTFDKIFENTKFHLGKEKLGYEGVGYEVTHCRARNFDSGYEITRMRIPNILDNLRLIKHSNYAYSISCWK